MNNIEIHVKSSISVERMKILSFTETSLSNNGIPENLKKRVHETKHN